MQNIIGLIIMLMALTINADEFDFKLKLEQGEIDKISITKNVSVVEKDGVPALYLSGRQLTIGDMKLPFIDQMAGKEIIVSYQYKLKDVPQPKKSWEGFKLMIRHDSEGKTYLKHIETPFGSSDWKDAVYTVKINKTPSNGVMRICIPGGEAWVRNVRIRELGVWKAYDFPLSAIKHLWTLQRCGTDIPDIAARKVSSHRSGIFTSPELDWKAKEIRQIEAIFGASRPGILTLTFNGTDGVNKVSSRMSVTLNPDGELHKVIVPVSDDPSWTGKISQISIMWACDEPSVLRLARVRAVSEKNLIPFAEMAGDKSEPIPTEYLRPRGKYTLAWKSGTNPGLELQCLDRNFKAIKTIELPKGKNSVQFESPELTMTGKIILSGKATGYPALVLDGMPMLNAQPTSWRGKWIWSQHAAGPEKTIIWFQHEFTLDGIPEEARICATADDGFVAYVNGKVVGYNGYWPEPKLIDIKKYLQPGKNTLAFRVNNVSSYGGLICDGFASVNGKVTWFCTDKNWKFKISKECPKTIDNPVVVIGSSETQPWCASLGYKYCGPKGKIKVTASNKSGFTIEAITSPPAELKEVVFRLDRKNASPRYYKLPITPSSCEWTVGKPVKLSIPVPQTESGTLFIDDPYLEVVNNVHAAIVEVPARKILHEFKPAKIEGCGTRPYVLIDGKKRFPAFMLISNGYNLDPTAKSFLVRDAKYVNFMLGISVAFVDFWTEDGKFDFTKFDDRISTAMAVYPDAKILINLDASMPEWWLQGNPASRAKWSNGQYPEKQHTDKQALSSKTWLVDARIPIKALLNHLKSGEYAENIFAVNLGECRNNEWLWETFYYYGNEHRIGWADADLATFRAFLKNKYGTDSNLAAAWREHGIKFSNCSMPMPIELSKAASGTLMDPEKNKKVMDWFEYRNTALAEAVIELCRIVKEESGGKLLTGAYYGYFVEFCCPSTRSLHDVGHNGFSEVARSKYVDFVRAPSLYRARCTGMADGVMQAQDAFSVHGKLVYVEQDFRTFTETQEKAFQWGRHSTAQDSIGALNRAFGMMLAQGVSHYVLDFGKWFYERILLDVLKEQGQVFDSLPPVKGTTPREVCIVGDRDSIYYTKRNPTGILPSAYLPLVLGFNECAMPFRTLAMTDLLEKGIVPSHKLYIMTNTFALSKEQRQALLSRFDREKATVIWMYAPGLFYPDCSPQTENIGDFLGLSLMRDDTKNSPEMFLEDGWGVKQCAAFNSLSPWFYAKSGFDSVIGKDQSGRPMLVSFKRGNSIHYFSTLLNLPMPLYRAIGERAGVHIYNQTSSDPMWIGNDVVFLHAKSSGEKSIILSPGTRMRAIIGPVEGSFESAHTWKAVAGQTYGFLIEKK